ncbi:hypothetical protein HZA33_03005 [Candidatus Pacearchaeota archaeon]|nr:hypothetical protein [Candidatus Pacearchaeota archaeon]
MLKIRRLEELIEKNRKLKLKITGKSVDAMPIYPEVEVLLTVRHPSSFDGLENYTKGLSTGGYILGSSLKADFYKIIKVIGDIHWDRDDFSYRFGEQIGVIQFYKDIKRKRK